MYRLAFAPLWLLAASLCAAPVPPHIVPQGGVLAPWGLIDADNANGFIAAPDGVYAFDLATGRQLWRLASRNARPVGVYRGRVLVLLRDDRERVVQLDRRTGKELARSEPVTSRGKGMGRSKGGPPREGEARVIGDVLVLGRSSGPPSFEGGFGERRFGPRSSGSSSTGTQIDLTTGKAPEKRVTPPARPRRVQDLLPKGVSVPGGGRFGPLFGQCGDAVFLLHSTTTTDEQPMWHLARWDARTGRPLPPTMVGEGLTPRLSGDGKCVLVGPRNNPDGTARFEVLSTATGRSLGTFEQPERVVLGWTVYGERAYVLSIQEHEEPGGRARGLQTLHAIELKTGRTVWSLLLATRPAT